MRICALWTGDELLDGRIQEANGRSLGAWLRARGHRLWRALLVGDDEDGLVAALSWLVTEADLVVVAGGLGPTEDDRTRAACARVSGRELVRDADAWQALRARYARLGRRWSDAAARQAERPASAARIPNPLGSADGFVFFVGTTPVVVLPGVPREFDGMLDAALTPYVAPSSTDAQELWLYGIGESETNAVARDIATEAGVSLGWCVQSPLVQLRWEGRGEAVTGAGTALRRAFAPFVLPEGHRRPETLVLELLRGGGATVAIAESCTGGAIASALTDVPGSSAALLAGWVTYANDAKVAALGVPREVIVAQGAVSAEVAVAMASGARRAANATWGGGVTGIAGPGGGSETKPVGTAFVAWAGPSGVHVARVAYPDRDRREVKALVRDFALCFLWRCLVGDLRAVASWVGVVSCPEAEERRLALADRN